MVLAKVASKWKKPSGSKKTQRAGSSSKARQEVVHDLSCRFYLGTDPPDGEQQL
jgi:hypothetical protein